MSHMSGMVFTEYEIQSYYDERNAQNLSHVYRERILKVHLSFFQELYEETEGESTRSKINAQGTSDGMPMISEFIKLASRINPAATGAATPIISRISRK